MDLGDKRILRRYIVCDPEKCLGCQICEFVCSATKEKSCDPSLSRIRVANFEPTGSMAIACLFCENPPCVAACPRDALTQSEQTGLIIVNEDACNGCGWCLEVCRFGALAWHPTKSSVITCDLCDGDPECVKFCPFEDALVFGTLEDVSRKFEKKTVVQLLQELITKP